MRTATTPVPHISLPRTSCWPWIAMCTWYISGLVHLRLILVTDKAWFSPISYIHISYAKYSLWLGLHDVSEIGSCHYISLVFKRYWVRSKSSPLTLNKPMKQSPSLGADSRPAGQNSLCLLWNARVHYCVHKGPPLDPILRQSTPSHPISLRSILIISSRECISLPSDFDQNVVCVSHS